MIRIKKKVISAILAVIACVLLVGCNNSKQEISYENSFAVKYDTGRDQYDNFDSEKFSCNVLDYVGADPGVIYVSEETDPVYGGYFYSYVTSCETRGFTPGTGVLPSDTVALVYRCARSKDLSIWEICGAADGYALIGRKSDWEEWGTSWAPEVIYNANDTEYPYYMFYTTPSKIRAKGRLASTPGLRYSSRMHIGIARAKSPVGPFYTYNDKETINRVEQNIPFIDFRYGYNLDYDVGVIDVHPYLDEDGELYLYFKPEGFEKGSVRRGIYGMKMKDWTTPDYSSVKLLAAGGYTTCSSNLRGKDAFLNLFTKEETSSWTEYDDGKDLLEAPYMYKHNDKYYLTYAFHGYSNPGYSVLQSIGDSPLGDFIAPQPNKGNPVLAGTQTLYMKGTAHHSLVRLGNELYIFYHRHANTESIGAGRYLAADKVAFTEVDGKTIMTANGPSIGLNFLGEELTGYHNVAKKAKVTATGGSGIEYLTDGLLPMYDYVSDKFFITDEDVTIKFEFKQPVKVETIMIHNARRSELAFSKVADIHFELAEQPSFLPDSSAFKYGSIKNLAFPAEYWKETNENYIACCSPAVAVFDEIKVKSISVTIKTDDKIIKEDKYGQSNKTINLSEIIILGR